MSDITFVGTAPCGCRVALVTADAPDLPRILRQWERQGLTRSYIPTAQVATAPWAFGHVCRLRAARQENMLAQLEDGP